MNVLLRLICVLLFTTLQAAQAGELNTGTVVGLIQSDHAVLRVKPDNGGSDVLVRLLDVEVPESGSAFWQSSVTGMCQLLCRQRISWDAITVDSDGIPSAYVYLGSDWVNRSVILHGFARAAQNPHHPELSESESEAMLVAVGIWQSKKRGDGFVEAVILDGAASPKGYDGNSEVRVASIETGVELSQSNK
jgi:endonuclease YncB( thermonuclease family)